MKASTPEGERVDRRQLLLVAGVQVSLRRRDLAVAQKVLDRPKVNTLVEERDGEGMSERVSRRVPLY